MKHDVSVSGEDQPDKNIESALRSIAKGNKPWEHERFGFKGCIKSRNGEFPWTILARKSKYGKPTLELYRSVPLGKRNFTTRIKIRFDE